MVSVDANVLIYAHRRESPHFRLSFGTLKRVVESGEPWMLTWQAVHEFIAVVTNPRIYKPPTPLADAIGQVEEWMASPAVTLANEAAGYWGHFKRLAQNAGVQGGAIYDVRLAAVGLSHGVNEILTNDSDFGRLESIRVRSL